MSDKHLLDVKCLKQKQQFHQQQSEFKKSNICSYIFNYIFNSLCLISLILSLISIIRIYSLESKVLSLEFKCQNYESQLDIINHKIKSQTSHPIQPPDLPSANQNLLNYDQIESIVQEVSELQVNQIK